MSRFIDRGFYIIEVAGQLAAWAIGRRSWYRVRGDSMAPTLENGDCVLADPKSPLTQGILVIARGPNGRTLIKRAASATATTFAVMSDNPQVATDSRHFGSLNRADYLGAVSLIFTRRGKLIRYRSRGNSAAR